MNPKRPTPRHTIIKMPSFKDREVTYKGAPIRLVADFSAEAFQSRREWQQIFQVMRNKGLQPRLLYPVRLSIKMEGEIRSVLDKRWLKEYPSTKPAL